MWKKGLNKADNELDIHFINCDAVISELENSIYFVENSDRAKNRLVFKYCCLRTIISSLRYIKW